MEEKPKEKINLMELIEKNKMVMIYLVVGFLLNTLIRAIMK